MKVPLILSLLLLAASPAAAEERRAAVGVSGLTCPSCSYIAGRSIEALDGAEVARFSAGERGTGTFEVVYDDAAVSLDAIVAAVEANGYDAGVLGDDAKPIGGGS